MKRITIQLDDELYQWLEQQADKHNQSPPNMVAVILHMRKAQLDGWLTEYNKRLADPVKAYKERERIRMAMARSRGKLL